MTIQDLIMSAEASISLECLKRLYLEVTDISDEAVIIFENNEVYHTTDIYDISLQQKSNIIQSLYNLNDCIFFADIKSIK